MRIQVILQIVAHRATTRVWSLMQLWVKFTPEFKFQLTVVLISSPLALPAALWSMTDKRTLQHMRPGRGQTVRMLSEQLAGVAAK